MSVQLKKGVLELCSLHYINNKDSYGYDIYQYVNKTIGINESTIYPILRKFTKEGYCETYLKESNEGPARKYFKITKTGLKRLSELKTNWYSFSKEINKILNEK